MWRLWRSLFLLRLRLLLLRLWLSLRLFFVAFAAACVGFFFRPLTDDFGGNLIVKGNIVVGEKIVIGDNFAPTGSFRCQFGSLPATPASFVDADTARCATPAG